MHMIKKLDIKALAAEIKRLETLTRQHKDKHKAAYAHWEAVPWPPTSLSRKEREPILAESMKRLETLRTLERAQAAESVRLVQLYCLRASHRGKLHMKTLWKSHHKYPYDLIGSKCRPSELNPRPEFTWEDQEKFTAPIKKEFLLRSVKIGDSLLKVREAFRQKAEILIPKIPWSEIRKIYHNSYWDGILSGVVEYKGHRYFLDIVEEHFYYREDEDGDVEPCERRTFALLELTEEEWALENRKHALFEEHVGTHTNYDPNDNLNRPGRVKSNANGEWGLYYGSTLAKERLNLQEKPVNMITVWE